LLRLFADQLDSLDRRNYPNVLVLTAKARAST
jgi:hypothetical protein